MSSALWPPAAAISRARLTILLALDLGEIQVVLLRLVEYLGGVHLGGRDFDFTFQKTRRFAKILNRDDLQPFDNGGFSGVFRRHEHADHAVGAGAQGDRQHALARTHRAGQGEFAHDDEIVELVGLDLFAGGQHAERNGQIEARPLLLHVGGREVDGRAPHRKLEPGIGERGGDPVAGFLHRGIRQADNDDQGVAPTGIDLDLDGIGFDAIKRRGTNPR